MFVRGGRSLGTTHFFPRARLGGEAEVLAAFLRSTTRARGAGRDPRQPSRSRRPTCSRQRCAAAPATGARSAAACAARARAGSRWRAPTRRQALQMRSASRARSRGSSRPSPTSSSSRHRRQRIECFDISHTGGEATVASCVVFGPKGRSSPNTGASTSRDVTPGDDYAAHGPGGAAALSRACSEGEVPMPDLLLIDGGAGPAARGARGAAGTRLDGVQVVGVAKGPTASRAGGLLLPGGSAPLILGRDSPALRLIQRMRDEAHRFAIAGHRRAAREARQRIAARGNAGARARQAPRAAEAFRRTAGRRGRRRSRTWRGCMESAASSPGRSIEHMHPGT